MLQKLNDRIQGVIAWVIVVLVTLTFTLFGLDYYLQSRHGSDAKVRVNDQVITKQAYELNYRRISQVQDPEVVANSDESTLKQQVLSEMIANAVRVESAHAYGFDVDNNQATSAILNIPQFQEDGHFSTSRYTQALSNAFFTPQTFQQEVRQGMLLNQQRFALIGSAFVLPTELNQFVQLSMQTRDYRYALIKATDFIPQVHVTDDEVKSYYQQHQQQFFSKELVSIDYIRLSLQDMKQTITISPEALLRYYEDNKANYLTPAQWQFAYIRFPANEQLSADEQAKVKQYAERVYDKLLAAPQRFETVAKELSAKQLADHGMLPLVVAGQSELDQQLLNLTVPGQISSPIHTKEGYELLQLISYKPATTQSFLEVKAMIEELLVQEDAQKQYADAVERLSELSYQNPDSLVEVAKELHVPVAHSTLFSRQGTTDGVTQHKAVLQAAFSHDVLVFGNNSEPVQLDTDDIVVLRVQQHAVAALQPLAAVESVIRQILMKQKTADAAQQYGKSIINHTLPTSETAPIVWHKVAAAGRDGDTPDSRINELAFGLSKTDDYDGCTLDNGDFAVVHLSKIDAGKEGNLDKEQMTNITQQIESSYGLMDYDLYVNQMMAQAKIVKY